MHMRWQRRSVVAAVVTLTLGACVPLAVPPAASAAVPATATTHLLATPTWLDFGDVQLGAGGQVQSVVVENVGSASVKLSGTFGSSGPFSSSGNCNGATLAKGATCHVSIGFTPTATGVATGTVVDTFNGVTLSTSVSGTGYSRVEVTPTSLDFGNVVLGEASPPQLVTITNITPQPMTMNISGGAGSSPFAGVQTCGGTVLAAGASCNYSYTFTPTALGGATAVAKGTVNGQSFSVALRGNGVPRFLITPTALAFGIVRPRTTSSTQTVTVTNRGAQPAVMSWTT